MNSALFLWVALTSQHPFLHSTAQSNDGYWYRDDGRSESLRTAKEDISFVRKWVDHHAYPSKAKHELDPSKSENEKPPPDQPGAEKQDWYPIEKEQIPFLAVIYRRDTGSSPSYKNHFPLEPDPGPSHIEPGTACGGALLSPDHVLTVCGCLMSVISNIEGAPSIFPPGYQHPLSYDIYGQHAQFEPPKIYVTLSKVRFEPDFKHEIVKDTKLSQFPTLTCKEFLEAMNRDHNGEDEGQKAAKVNAQLVVITFTPAINGIFPKWPPIPIDESTDSTYTETVELLSIGMRQLEQHKYNFFSSICASSTKLKHCKWPSFVCNNTRVPRGHEHACFCPVVDNFWLTGGVIGWPIVKTGRLVGLTASERHPVDGTVLAAVLHPAFVRSLEEYGKTHHKHQNTPVPLYRGNDLPKDFFIYDYNLDQEQKKERPVLKAQSVATNISPSAFEILCIASFLNYLDGVNFKPGP